MSARRAFAIVFLALVLAALLNAETLEATARAQPFGWRHDVATALAEPLADVSRTLHATAPRRWLEDLLDRPSVDGAEGPAMPPSTVTSSTVTSTTAPSGTPTTSPATTTTVPPRRPTASDPLRLWVAGDSMTEVAGGAIVDLAEATGAIDGQHDFRYSSGLTRPDYYDWYAAASAAIAERRPEVVVVMFGANDAQGIVTATGPEPFGTEAWVAEYRARVAAMMDLLESDGRVVYWIGQPVMRSDSFSERMSVLDAVYADEAAGRERVRYVDSWSLFADASGGYAAYLPGADGTPVLVRQGDGIHLTRAGGERLARVVVDLVVDRFGIEEER
jgi:hypothetical protein